MIIYKDILTGDELVTDSFKPELVDGLFYKFMGKHTTMKDGVEESMIGGNASAEVADEDVEENVVHGVDIVLANRLKELPGVDKKTYMGLFKIWAKSMVTHFTENEPDKLPELKERLVLLQKAVKALWVAKDTFQVYQGEKGTSEGMFTLLGYTESDDTPYMLFFKDGLIEEKC